VESLREDRARGPGLPPPTHPHGRGTSSVPRPCRVAAGIPPRRTRPRAARSRDTRPRHTWPR